MSELMTALEAKELAELQSHKKEAQKLINGIAGQIKHEAMQGRYYLSINGTDWDTPSKGEYRLARLMLTDAGYKVERHDYEYAPNGGRPETIKAVRISW